MSQEKPDSWNKGIIRCARYAFMPNKLSFCGPDKNKDLFYYCSENKADSGLNSILEEFQTLYPYLRFIAKSNRIKDPFDEKVIEAYWLGNQLLERIDQPSLYYHLNNNLEIKKKVKLGSYRKIEKKISLGAKPHHNFHVFSVWQQAKNQDLARILSSMDLCRISWGRVLKVGSSILETAYQPLTLKDNSLILGSEKMIQVNYQANAFLKKIKPGDWISLHWGFACEKLNDLQVAYLKKYTQENIQLNNLY